MKLKSKRLILISTFCIFIFVIGVGYALMRINTSIEKALNISNMNILAQGISEKIVSKGIIAEGDIPIPQLDISFKEHYAPDGKLVDKWGIPYNISVKKIGNKLFIIIKSAGPDKLFDTKDDMQLEKEYILK